MEEGSSANITKHSSRMQAHDDFSFPYTNIKSAVYMDLHYLSTLGFTSCLQSAFQSNSTFFFSEASLLYCWLYNSHCYSKYHTLSHYYLCFECFSTQLFQNQVFSFLRLKRCHTFLNCDLSVFRLNCFLHLVTVGLCIDCQGFPDGEILKGHIQKRKVMETGVSQTTFDRENRMSFGHL